MIRKLAEKEHHQVENLVKSLDNFPEMKSVVANVNPGSIYVNENCYESALVWNQGMQGFYFIGDASNKIFAQEIKSYVNDTLIEFLRSVGMNWFEVSGVNDAWNDTIEEIFEDKGIEYEHQLAYRMDKLLPHSRSKLCRHGMTIHKFEKNTLDEKLVNIEFITKELEQFWGSLQNFYENGLCYYATEGTKVVSLCYSGFKSDNILTIGVETLNEYRKKGYAYELSAKFIDQCRITNKVPYWDCSDSNMGSRRLAEKLGFEYKDKYRCYWFRF